MAFEVDAITGEVYMVQAGSTLPTDLKVDWQKCEDIIFNQQNIRWVVYARLLPEKPGAMYETFVNDAAWQELADLRETGGRVRVNGKFVKELPSSYSESILGQEKFALQTTAAVSASASATATTSLNGSTATASATSGCGSVTSNAYGVDGGDIVVYSAHRKGLWGREVTESRITRRNCR
jgi:hypothetical protein